MIGYKCTDQNGCCMGFKFEVGKTYKKDTPKEDLKCCTDKVFHFCRELFAIEKVSDYKLSESRIFEVIAGDFVKDGDKYGTNCLTIIREIKGAEKQNLLNSGDYNSGYRNSGDLNSGYRNSGDLNSGFSNSGDRNSGDSNSGDRNGGNWNSGDRNGGNRNSGDLNGGDLNSGYCNSGDGNSGDCNSGFRNSGYRNSGNRNSGNWNSGDGNSGYFNSDSPKIRIFNKETENQDIEFPDFLYFDLTVWVSHDTATETEKEEHSKEIEATGGFLKTLGYKEAFKLAWDKADKSEHKQLLALPNWDNEIFKEISGIDAEAEIKKEND